MGGLNLALGRCRGVCCLNDIPGFYFFSRQVAAAVDDGDNLNSVGLCAVDDPVALKYKFSHVVPIGFRNGASYLGMVL